MLGHLQQHGNNLEGLNCKAVYKNDLPCKSLEHSCVSLLKVYSILSSQKGGMPNWITILFCYRRKIAYTGGGARQRSPQGADPPPPF
jgi:hypothetical protein